MTAPDPRLDEIQARLDKANAEMDRLTERNPGSAWRWSIPANPERDSDLILSASIADVAYLLAELRKAREAVADAKAEALEEAADAAADPSPEDMDTYFLDQADVGRWLHARAASLRGES